MNLKRLFAVSLGHFAIDILNSSVAIVLTALAGRFDLNNSQIALAVMTYTFAASLTQPIFGWLADRIQGHWLGTAGLVWTMIFFGLASFAQSYLMLVVILTVGALGSGAFHPVGVMGAGQAGGVRATSATSVFFVCGQTGLALGPMISGYVLQAQGLAGLPAMALAMIPAVLVMLYALRPAAAARPVTAGHRVAAPSAAPATEGQVGVQQSAGWAVLTAFVALIAIRSTTLQSFTSLLPKYFADQGVAPAEYGTMLGVFSLAAAMGTLAGGYLGDRYNRRHLIFGAMVVSVPFTQLLLSSHGVGYYLAAISAGFLLNLPHSILVIVAQRLLPRQQGLASGAVLGFMFASGAATTAVVGWLADWLGLGPVLWVVGLLPILAAACALFLPSTRSHAISSPSAPALPARR